ncbi:hypothetical protein ADL03_12365 [Nocardia sp. NRRL S-836]|nr:hypothetical protein ADL03_12365 [Nocardia sp. NRRL S-836]
MRIAHREARRSKGRTALVATLIAVPVAALSFAAVTYDSYELTPDETATRSMGSAQALVSWPYSRPVTQEPDEVLAVPTPGEDVRQERSDARLGTLLADAALLPVEEATTGLRTTAGVADATVHLLDLTNPRTTGLYALTSGRAPATTSEVALSARAAERTGAHLDGTVSTADNRTFTVVGTFEDPDDITDIALVSVPGAVSGATRSWLTTTVLDWAEVKDLNKLGIAALSRAVLRSPPPADQLYDAGSSKHEVEDAVLVLIAGLAVLQTSLLAGAALAVGTRRRKRDLALVGAIGGAPSHIRRIVLADGVVVGVLAAAGGVLLGATTAALGRPVVEWALEERFGAQRFYPTALLTLAALAVVTGLLAALVPAWVSSRQDVVTALAGRRGVTRSRRRWLALGLTLVTAGVAVGVTAAITMVMPGILVALILTELGLVLCTPSLLGALAKAGHRLPVPLRMALRDASRNRTAAAPAISAVMAAVIGTVAVSVILSSQASLEAGKAAGREGDVSITRAGLPDQSRSADFPTTFADAMRATLPVAETHPVKALAWRGLPSLAHIRPPADQECPYLPFNLGRDVTDTEQQQAKADPRCQGAASATSFFGTYGSSVGFVAVIAPEAATAVLHLPKEDEPAVIAALREGKVVVHSATLVRNGKVRLAAGSPTSGDPGEVPGMAAPHSPPAPLSVLSEDTARSLGFEVVPLAQFATTTRTPTEAEQEALQAAVGPKYTVTVTRPSTTETQGALTVLALISAFITLAAAALATGLAAAEGRRDLTTLAAVGAAPSLRKLLTLSQTGVIAGLGSLLGTTAGVACSLAVLAALNVGYARTWPSPPPNPLTVPWPNIAIALFVVPLAAMLGAALFTRSRLPVERRA